MLRSTLLAAIAAAALLVACGGANYPPEPIIDVNGDDQAEERPSNAREVSASTLTRAYEENNVAAQRDYGDQRYAITGLVRDAGVDD